MVDRKRADQSPSIPQTIYREAEDADRGHQAAATQMVLTMIASPLPSGTSSPQNVWASKTTIVTGRRYCTQACMTWSSGYAATSSGARFVT